MKMLNEINCWQRGKKKKQQEEDKKPPQPLEKQDYAGSETQPP